MNIDFLSTPSHKLDQELGFRIDEIEDELLKKARKLRPEGNMSNFSEVLHDGHQTWIGLDPQTLNTPYDELFEMCTALELRPDDLVVDLGAGYGRLGILLKVLHPEVKFLGYELVEERVQEGNRILAKHNCSNANLFVQDLTESTFKLPLADVYFLYDYGKVSHIRQTLKEIEKFTDKHHFQVVARGQGSTSIIDFEHPWLSQVMPVYRSENFSIYSF